jgi:hypothetical protein
LIDLEEIKPKTSKIRIVGDVSRRESMIRVIRDYEDGVRRPCKLLPLIEI